MLKTEVFDKHAKEYDAWFDNYPFVFQSEVEALKALLPIGDSHGIEVGLGSGRFAKALGIKEGVEPAEGLREMALNRGIEVFDATAEHLPYKDLRFDFVLMTSCVSYLDGLLPAFKEANRVLRPSGSIIVGFIPRDSFLGKSYEAKRSQSTFYKQATYYTPERVAEALRRAGFVSLSYSQTVFHPLHRIGAVEQAEEGHDKGSFVMIKAAKK